MEGLENTTFKVVDNENLETVEPQGFVFEEPKGEETNVETEVTSIETETEPIVEEVQTEEAEIETNEIKLDNQVVLSYLNDKLGLDIDDLDNLTKKEEKALPEDIQAYLKYREDTGRSFQDFLEAQKDWGNENEDVLLKKYIAEKNPYFDADDVESEIADKFTFDEDYDSETDVKKITRDKKRILAEAKEYFKEQNEKYKVPLESNDDFIPLEYKEAKQALQEINEKSELISMTEEKAVNYFKEKTDSLFSKEFKGFEFKIDNEEIVYKPTNIEEVKNSQMNIGNFIDKYLGDDGFIKDVKGYHKALNLAMNPDAMAKHFFELGKAKAIEDISKDRKNIDTGFAKAKDGNNSATTFRVLNPDVSQTFR